MSKSFKKLVFVITLAGVLSLGVFVSLSRNTSSPETLLPAISLNGVDLPSARLTGDISVNTNKNLSIKIPTLDIHAPIESIGLTPQGAVGTPQKFANAGWYNLGPSPGEIGNAVVVGHFGWKNGQPGVFNAIHKLQKGDKIYIENNGQIITFIVREFRTYRADETDEDIFYSRDGKAHLNLITCKGVWDSVSKSYPERFIVFTDKEMPL